MGGMNHDLFLMFNKPDGAKNAPELSIMISYMEQRNPVPGALGEDYS